MKVAVSALFLFLFTVLASAQSAPPTQGDVATGKASGLGFTLDLPPNVSLDVLPTTNLAFGLNLSDPNTHGREWDGFPPRFIGFTTQWDNETGSLDAVVSKMTADVQNLVPAGLAGEGVITLESTFPAKLGTLPARRLVVTFRNRQKKPSIRQIVVAYRTRPDASAIVYLATLTTTRDTFAGDLSLFAKLLAGFKLAPIQ